MYLYGLHDSSERKKPPMRFSPNMEYRVKKGNSDLKLGQDGQPSLDPQAKHVACGRWGKGVGSFGNDGETAREMVVRVYRRRGGHETGH